MESRGPRLIAANYDFRIVQCTVSSDGKYLVASTNDPVLFHWSRRGLGPVLSGTTLFDFDKREIPLTHSVAAAASDRIVVGTSEGRLYFVDIGAGRKFTGKGFDESHKVRAVVAHGSRLYITATIGNQPYRIGILAYTTDKCDFESRKPIFERNQTHAPRIGSIWIHKPNQTSLAEPSSSGDSSCMRMIVSCCLKLARLLVALVALATLIAATLEMSCQNFAGDCLLQADSGGNF
ncbi:hypothetical protein RhiJN_27241 [Ceratobasidium sp. AG-Ba]|nr:hypothetical protein RhiJN_27241 [Ceratobasidium sp. AG-Ba]